MKFVCEYHSIYIRCVVLQVVKLPVDFVFFRVRANGDIGDPDYLLPGFAMARAQIRARMAAYRAGMVPLPPKNAKPKKFRTWRYLEGNDALKAREGKLPSIDYGSPVATAARMAAKPLPQEAANVVQSLREWQKGVAGKTQTKEEEQPQSSKKENKSPKPQKDVDPQSEEWDNSVAVCAIMKQEKLSDIREWLLYHQCALPPLAMHRWTVLHHPSCRSLFTAIMSPLIWMMCSRCLLARVLRGIILAW